MKILLGLLLLVLSVWAFYHAQMSSSWFNLGLVVLGVTLCVVASRLLSP